FFQSAYHLPQFVLLILFVETFYIHRSFSTQPFLLSYYPALVQPATYLSFAQYHASIFLAYQLYFLLREIAVLIVLIVFVPVLTAVLPVLLLVVSSRVLHDDQSLAFHNVRSSSLFLQFVTYFLFVKIKLSLVVIFLVLIFFDQVLEIFHSLLLLHKKTVVDFQIALLIYCIWMHLFLFDDLEKRLPLL